MIDRLLAIGDLVFLLTSTFALGCFWLVAILGATKPTFAPKLRRKVSTILVRHAAKVCVGSVWDQAEVKVNMELEISVPIGEAPEVGKSLGMKVEIAMTPAQQQEVDRLNRMYEGSSDAR